MSARPLPVPINPALLRHAEQRRQSLENRVADAITRFAGSMLFVYLHVIWFAAWIGFRVEHYPFGLLTMIVSLEAIFLSTFVMISQNRADEKRQVLADHQWQTVQEEEQQNEELLRLPNQIFELTKAIHAMTAAATSTSPGHLTERAGRACTAMEMAKTVVDKAFVRTPNFPSHGCSRAAETQVSTAVGRSLLARRKSGVQIPSPPPHRRLWSVAPSGSSRRGRAIRRWLAGQQSGSNRGGAFLSSEEFGSSVEGARSFIRYGDAPLEGWSGRVEPEVSDGTADLRSAPHHVFTTHDHQVDGATPHALYRPHRDLPSAS
jgi:uncharacterized membrane protein